MASAIATGFSRTIDEKRSDDQVEECRERTDGQATVSLNAETIVGWGGDSSSLLPREG
jgi:hypothetical protein